MDGAGFAGVIRPSDGQQLFNPIGGAMVVKVRDATTHDGLSVHDNVVPPNSPGPRRHRHLLHDEVFYVISGTLTVEIEGEICTAPAGAFVVIPRGSAHRPSNRTGEPTHVLLMFSPGGMDSFFVEAAERHLRLAGPSDPAVTEAMDDFCDRYGFAFADLPAS